MKNKISLLLIISVLVIALASCAANNENITVFDGGQTGYSFITAENASEDVMGLANSLASLSGASPTVSTDASSEVAKEILIGDTNRKATSEIVKKLNEGASAVTFQYIIAELDGKIVILSDADIGYVYAFDYIKTKYIKDGNFTIAAGTLDVKKVLWDEYYSSDLYYETLLEEADKNRYENELGQFKDDLNNYEDTKESPAMTITEAIEYYKGLSASFNTASFTLTSGQTYEVEEIQKIFKNGNKYKAPTIYPDKGEHPRMLFTANTIDEVRKNIKSPESKKAYDRYIALSDSPWDGKFNPTTATSPNNSDGGKAAIIEAKAFRYAMTGEEIYGYQAIYAAKNAILTLDVATSVSDYCRPYGHLMYVVSCVYDWCYDLLTDLDKEQIIVGCVNILGYIQEVVSQSNKNNILPTGQGTAYGHGAEDQILTDYLAFAIACFDEAPEIYELVGGRVLNDYVEHQNYIGQSGTFWEGSMYGSVRGVATMVSNILFNKMTDGAANPFDYLQAAITSSTYWIRPDGHVFRIGDTNENNTAYQFVWMSNNCFYAGNLYNDPYLKSVAYKYLNGFNSFTNMVAGLSVIQFLAINDPAVSHVNENEAALVYESTYPYTNVFAKSADNDKNAFGLFMSANEMFAPSHAHAEAGSFQIFYKGALASKSGAYDGWGSNNHYGYYMDTVSSNSILVFDPNVAKEFKNLQATGKISVHRNYTGGQLWNGSPDTLEELMENPQLGQCTSLGKASLEKDGKLVYTYLATDMTGAYDQRTVDEVSRYMIAVATGDTNRPYVFITYDRITSDDAAFRKSALIHVQSEPTVTGDGFVVITNTEKMGSDDKKGNTNNGYQNNGKLVVQTVGEATEYVVIGGEGKECWVPGLDENGNYSLEAGKNVPIHNQTFEGSLEEYGWGRIEITPQNAGKTNSMLTVMYVTDADNNSANIKATDIGTAALAGSEIFGKAIFFPKNDKFITAETSFTLGASADTCYVTGVMAGKWTIAKDGAVIDTITVGEGRTVDGTYTDGEHIITFAAQGAGTYTITPAN